jgi:hypothetical protein
MEARNCLAETGSYEMEHPIRARRGLKWILDRGLVTLWDENSGANIPQLVSGIQQDITQQALSKMRFKAISEVALSMVADNTLKENLTLVMKKVAHILGARKVHITLLSEDGKTVRPFEYSHGYDDPEAFQELRNLPAEIGLRGDLLKDTKLDVITTNNYLIKYSRGKLGEQMAQAKGRALAPEDMVLCDAFYAACTRERLGPAIAAKCKMKDTVTGFLFAFNPVPSAPLRLLRN